MKRLLLAFAAAGAAAAALGGPAGATEPQNENWHVHDCTLPAAECPAGHAPAGFFPAILGQSLAQYLEDPATCPNATDKGLLPNGRQDDQPLRAGVCTTSTTLIHLRSIPVDEQAPEGWALQGVSGGFATYYKLTPR